MYECSELAYENLIRQLLSMEPSFFMEFGKLYKVLMKMTDLKGKFDDETITIDGFTFRRLLKRSAEFGIKVFEKLCLT